MVDLVEITVKAGDGGDGAVSFHREKYKPKGPPDGGNGGKGGDIYLLAETNLATLYDFKRQKYFKAERGKRGGRNNRTGKSGEDLILKVPVGTVIETGSSGHVNRAQKSDTPFYPHSEDAGKTRSSELLNHGEKLLVARGGEGGRGNAKLRSSTNRSPRRAQKGAPGEEKVLTLELKLIADVGLIGLPNAGKTTLLNALTAAKGKVGRYPFTTLSPNLGVLLLSRNERWPHQNNRQIILADIPGLIEGAAKGRGLGHAFLRHIERTKVLVHLIDPMLSVVGADLRAVPRTQRGIGVRLDVTSGSIPTKVVGVYKTVRGELHQFSPKLSDKPEIVVINKLDLPEVKEMFPKIKEAFEKEGIEVFGISALTGEGLGELKRRIAKFVEAARIKENSAAAKKERPLPRFTIDDLPNKRMIFKFTGDL